MRRAYTFTFGTVAIVMLAYLATFRLAGSYFGADGFGEYALARRTLSLLAPIGLLGSDYATARFVAFLGDRDRHLSRSYYPAALAVMLLGATAVSIPLVLYDRFLASVLFGSPIYAATTSAMPWAVFGIGLHSITYNYLRGDHRFSAANLLMALNYGLVPLIAIREAPSVPLMLVWMGIGQGLTALAFIPRLRARFTLSLLRMREIARYGLPRVPGDVLLLLLFALPSIIAAHLADIASAGFVALGTAALGVVGSALSPISMILLPTSARNIANNRLERVRVDVVRIVAVVLVCVIPGTIVCELFLDPIVGLYLGPNLTGGLDVIRVLILAGLPMSLFTVLRSVIDAQHVRAVNTRNIAISTVVFGAGTMSVHAILPGIVPVLLVFDAAITVLGVLTVVEVYRIVRRRQPNAGGDPSGPSGDEIEMSLAVALGEQL